MNYDDLFTAYYTQYRAEAEIPNNEDDEYKIAIPLFNEAIQRWSTYDNTMWHELYTTLQESGDGDLTLVEGQTDYAAPDDMKLAGGHVMVINPNGTRAATFPLVEPQDVQFMTDTANYAYFTGNPSEGYTLHVNPAPSSTLDGLGLNYIYYKNPAKFTFGGTEVAEMSDPYFIVHRALANRFRASRNPYYTYAKQDAEDALRTMQLQNNSGNWADPWSVPDRSGTLFGG